MRSNTAIPLLLALALVGSGCATKKYVAQTTQPIQTQLNTVADTQQKQGATLDETRKNLERDETELSATTEKANTADARSTDALNKIAAVDQKTDKNSQDISSLRNSLGSLDDYKQAAQTTVLFNFNSDKLTDEGKQELDQIASQLASYKRFYITVEGFTDQLGPADYNDQLSERRAQAVLDYLVGEKDVPLYRVQIVGLGKTHLVDAGHTRDARAKNRRVEITIYSADMGSAASASTGSTQKQ
jgi:outer membrane protein OmpA-like peptidoglycan-associated protein